MAQTTDQPLTSGLPDLFSSALIGIFETVRPGIVQVHTHGRGGGTGIIIAQDGRMITNNHVVARDDARVQVLLSDGRTLDANVLLRNPQLDLALLKINGDNLQALKLGDFSRLRVGEWVFAVGHPWGQRWVMTAGIVSLISTLKISDDVTTQYIKSDVSLAPGNSGGPLLNADGHVVGINSMIFGGDLSISIPSSVVSKWLDSLPSSKPRISLGVELQAVELPAHIRQKLQPSRATGLLIVGLSARDQQLTDLLIGDILLEAAGQPIADAATLRAILAQGEEGAPVRMNILRGGALITVDVATQTTP